MSSYVGGVQVVVGERTVVVVVHVCVIVQVVVVISVVVNAASCARVVVWTSGVADCNG